MGGGNMTTSNNQLRDTIDFAFHWLPQEARDEIVAIAQAHTEAAVKEATKGLEAYGQAEVEAFAERVKVLLASPAHPDDMEWDEIDQALKEWRNQ